MTGSQIKVILSDCGYDSSKDLDLGKFAVILLDQDANIFPDVKRKRFKFDFTNEALQIFTGRTKGGQFYYDKTDRANHYISFSDIAGFVQTSKVLDNGQVMYGL